LENSYETIKIFDKIIIDPDKVHEGQIIEWGGSDEYKRKYRYYT
jgi:hypothetical protein